MSSRIPLQTISNNLPEYSSMMYEPYCDWYYYENPDMYTENTHTNNSIYQTYDANSTSITSSSETKKKSTRRSKHIPHHLRPQHIVEKRNRRERLRVQDVNQAFTMLQQLLPLNSTLPIDQNPNSSRISKVRTLRAAVDYIQALQNMLNEHH